MKKHIVFDHPIIFGTIIMYLVYLSMSITALVAGFVVDLFPVDDASYDYLVTIAAYLVTGSVLLLVMKHQLNKEYHFFRNWDKTGKALLLLWPCFLVMLLNAVPHIIAGSKLAYNGLAMVTCIISNLCTGYFEEVTFRGAVVSNSMRVWKDKKDKVLYTVILSAIPFSLIHFMNISVNGVPVTLLQVAYAIGFGMIFAAVYLRTGNLFSCVLVHGLVDVTAYLFEGGSTEVNMASIIILLAITAVCIVYSLFLLKKKDEIEEFESI